MKSILADYDKDNQKVTVGTNAEPEDWVKVCTRFNDDVHRIRDVTDIEGFTALYQCFDDDNRSIFYLVNEDKSLFRLRRKRFLENIGTGGKKG
ncbi:hypothetical protein HRM2_42250 [Desulforapulum autotrophicum HRM2]|uniref:Uncharacterized protein n=1 Tax=Desulforapulum autotrophicum (strain ATCC 43914 / DSM 3382 / VKM B-1955 / HRM2) TaxID=177437 RepID=C0QD49_DESAH|nr:hypothetical protein [Desulforapulum autotrophicum]ACN17281.1 hypothetical protein HRM2_42250 [Desulforapulum autotrophicum HRM2]